MLASSGVLGLHFEQGWRGTQGAFSIRGEGQGSGKGPLLWEGRKEEGVTCSRVVDGIVVLSFQVLQPQGHLHAGMFLLL